MKENEMLDKINGLLSETDYPLDIKNVADLEDFLNDDANRRLEAYEVIGRMYDDMMYQPEIDRRPEAF